MLSEAQDLWVLGVPAMSYYYVVHDYSKDVIGIAPLSTGKKGQLLDYPFLSSEITPLKDPSFYPWWAWFLIGIAIAVVAVVVIGVVKKKKEENSGKGWRTQDVWDTM